MAEHGRRDRKRAATEDALHATALALFAERGYAQTTIADITEAVDVSERTFFRYFPTKEDVLLHGLRTLRPKLLEALAARPSDEPPLRAILAALLAVRDNGRRLSALVLLPAPAEPTPSPRTLRVFAEWEAGLVGALLSRAGIENPDEHDLLRAEVTARAALAGLRTALSRYRALEPRLRPGAFARLADEAFTILEQGCPATPSG